MDCRLSLDIVVIKGPAIFKLFASKNEPLLVTWFMHVIESLLFNLENTHVRACVDCKSFSFQGLDEDLKAVREYDFLAQDVNHHGRGSD